jgi:hypothetical protein
MDAGARTTKRSKEKTGKEKERTEKGIKGRRLLVPQ